MRIGTPRHTAEDLFDACGDTPPGALWGLDAYVAIIDAMQDRLSPEYQEIVHKENQAIVNKILSRGEPKQKN